MAADRHQVIRNFSRLGNPTPPTIAKALRIISNLAHGVGHSAPNFGHAEQVFSTRSASYLQGLQILSGIDSIRVDDRHGMAHFLWNRRRRTAVATGDDKIAWPGRRQARKPNVADLGIRLFYNSTGDNLSLLLEPRPLVRIVQVNRKSTLSYNNVNHKQL